MKFNPTNSFGGESDMMAMWLELGQKPGIHKVVPRHQYMYQSIYRNLINFYSKKWTTLDWDNSLMLLQYGAAMSTARKIVK